jgi:hypothetical protein
MLLQIKRDIACLTQDHMNVAAYYTKLKGLWDELGPIMTLFVLVEQAIRDTD